MTRTLFLIIMIQRKLLIRHNQTWLFCVTSIGRYNNDRAVSRDPSAPMIMKHSQFYRSDCKWRNRWNRDAFFALLISRVGKRSKGSSLYLALFACFDPDYRGWWQERKGLLLPRHNNDTTLLHELGYHTITGIGPGLRGGLSTTSRSESRIPRFRIIQRNSVSFIQFLYIYLHFHSN
jgi:hypothetical protein